MIMAMAKLWVLALIAVGAVLPSLSFAVSPTGPLEKLAIVVGFKDHYSSASIAEMKRELESVLTIRGLQIEWRDLETMPAHEVFDHIVVARFTGRCESDLPQLEGATDGTLGFSHISDGAVIPFTEVDCNKIRNLISRSLQGESFIRMEYSYARALGRDLAHEIYHILGETLKHSKHGIAKALLSPQDLVSGRLEFESAQLDLLQRKVIASQPEHVAHASGQ